jgi:hypothetical protein
MLNIETLAAADVENVQRVDQLDQFREIIVEVAYSFDRERMRRPVFERILCLLFHSPRT